MSYGVVAFSDIPFSDQGTVSVTVSVTTIPVHNTNPFTTSGTVQIDDEKITYTGVSGTSLTGCTRGASSTTAASHSNDSLVTQV